MKLIKLGGDLFDTFAHIAARERERWGNFQCSLAVYCRRIARIAGVGRDLLTQVRTRDTLFPCSHISVGLSHSLSSHYSTFSLC